MIHHPFVPEQENLVSKTVHQQDIHVVSKTGLRQDTLVMWTNVLRRVFLPLDLKSLAVVVQQRCRVCKTTLPLRHTDRVLEVDLSHH
jgi:hypothetical protein